MSDDPIADRFEVFDQVTPPDNWERVVATAAGLLPSLRARRVALAAAAAIVVVAAAAAVWTLTDDKGRQIATTPGETATSTIDGRGETALLDVLVAEPNGPRLAVLDLEAGELRQYPPGSNTLPPGAISGASLSPGGGALVWSQGTVYVFADRDFTRTPVAVTPEELVAEPGTAIEIRVVPAADGEALWIVQAGERIPDGTVVDLIDIDTGEVLLHTNLPTKRAFPVDATPSGLILNAEDLIEGRAGGYTHRDSGHVVAVTETGTVDELGAGDAIAAKDEVVAIASIDGATLEVVNLETGARRTVEPPRTGTWIPVGGPSIPGNSQPLPTISTDGRLLVAIAGAFDVDGVATDSTLYSVALADAAAERLADFSGAMLLATWSRDASDVVLMNHDEVFLLDRANGAVTTIAEIPEGTFPLGAG